jgi:hypothetical protein
LVPEVWTVREHADTRWRCEERCNHRRDYCRN